MTATHASFWRSYCHCTDCRRQTGAPVTVFVGFKSDQLNWKGDPSIWRNGDVERWYCGTCGSQIGYLDDKLPGEFYFHVGFLDHPEDFPPTLHAFERSKLPFPEIEDDLPSHHGFSIER